MEEELNSLLQQECFYLKTSLGWSSEREIRLDKCVFLVVERGKGILQLGEEEFEANRSRAFFLRPELPLRKVRSTADFSVSMVAFPPYMLRECAQRFEPRFMLRLFTKLSWTMEDKARKLARHFIGLFCFAVDGYGRGYTRDLALNLVEGFVYGFYELAGAGRLGEVPVESSRSRELFRNFMDLLHGNLEREHEVQFYAGKLCISAKYLTQICKDLLGRTPKQIIDEALLQEAMKLLDKNDSSIQDISVSLGFPDQSYFGRFFKRMKQMSPQQYRLRAVRRPGGQDRAGQLSD